jgi:hypothetical protein
LARKGHHYVMPEDDTAGYFRVQEVDERTGDRPGRIVHAPLSFGHPAPSFGPTFERVRRAS